MRVLLAGAIGAMGRPLIRGLKQHVHSVFGLARSAESTRTLGSGGLRNAAPGALQGDSQCNILGSIRTDGRTTFFKFFDHIVNQTIEARRKSIKSGSCFSSSLSNSSQPRSLTKDASWSVIGTSQAKITEPKLSSTSSKSSGKYVGIDTYNAVTVEFSKSGPPRGPITSPRKYG